MTTEKTFYNTDAKAVYVCRSVVDASTSSQLASIDTRDQCYIPFCSLRRLDIVVLVPLDINCNGTVHLHVIRK